MTMHQQRILVVDDDPDLRELIRHWLSQANVEVLLASDGEEAFQILNQAQSIDLILTDFMMPELNGIELLRRLKADTKLFGTRVVVMTNNTDPEFRMRALEMGAVAYLAKSTGARLLAAKAIEMLPGREPEIPAGPARSAPAAQVQAMQQSLLALIRLTLEIEGMPPPARSALLSAEKLAESLFAPGP